MSDYPMLISNKLHSFRNFSLQIYEICGEKATFSFFLKKEEKTRAGKRGTGSAGKRMREEENGRGEKG